MIPESDAPDVLFPGFTSHTEKCKETEAHIRHEYFEQLLVPPTPEQRPNVDGRRHGRKIGREIHGKWRLNGQYVVRVGASGDV